MISSHDFLLQAAERIIVMPGGGLTERNLRRVLDETGAREFHGSARDQCDSFMQYRASWVKMAATAGDEYTHRITASDHVKAMLRISKQAM